MILLYGFLGLGMSEVVVIAVAILFLIGPKNITLIKPFVKSAYRMWLTYQSEVASAENEMDEMKHVILAPIEEAEKEVEEEVREIRKSAQKIKKPDLTKNFSRMKNRSRFDRSRTRKDAKEVQQRPNKLLQPNNLQPESQAQSKTSKKKESKKKVRKRKPVAAKSKNDGQKQPKKDAVTPNA